MHLSVMAASARDRGRCDRVKTTPVCPQANYRYPPIDVALQSADAKKLRCNFNVRTRHIYTITTNNATGADAVVAASLLLLTNDQ